MHLKSRRLALGAGIGLAAGSLVQAAHAATVPPVSPKPMVARMWHGRTPAAKADDYQAYLYESGVKRIAEIPGNRGVQMMVSKTPTEAEFMVVSFWDSRDAIKGYAGEDYTRVHDLPRDREFLIEPETLVRHFDLPVNFWQVRGSIRDRSSTIPTPSRVSDRLSPGSGFWLGSRFSPVAVSSTPSG